MKISNLLETITPSSSTANTNTSAPQFGRSDKFLEEEQIDETSAGATGSGSVASVASPVGGMQRRGKGSIFGGIKTSAKFPNSKQVKEGAYEDGVQDGIRGEANPRASSIYGPESNEYSRGYKDGLVKGKEQQQQNIANYQAELAPYKEIETDELKQMLRDIQQRSDARQAIYDKYRGSSLHGSGKLPPNHAELKKENTQDNKAWQAIHQELFQRGVPQDRRLEEADEWEEDTDKRQRFLAYAKQKLIAAAKNHEQFTQIALTLSAQDNKYFGSPFINNPNINNSVGFGSVSVGPVDAKYTDAIARMVDWIKSSQGQAQVSAQQAAVWLQPHGKEFLERVHNDLLGMQDNTVEARQKHAIALSGYQVEHLGGKVRGSYKGDSPSEPRDMMTQEVYDIFNVVEMEIGKIKNQQLYDKDIAERKKIWDAIPMPIKQTIAAEHNMNPEQFEAMLFGETDADKIAGYYNNQRPAHADELAEGNPFLQQAGFGGGKFPEPRKPLPGQIPSKSETLGKDGLIYHWRDPRAKGVAEAKKAANTKTFRAGLKKRVKAAPSEKEQEKKQAESDAAWERLMAFAAAQKKDEVGEAVTLDRSKVPNYPNDVETTKHRIATAQAILSDPNSDYDSRRIASSILAQNEKLLSQYKDTEKRYKGVAESSESDRIQALYDKLERFEERLGSDDPRVQALKDEIRGLRDEYSVVGQNTANSLRGELSEKSKSQAQFRTMAAVAHNPKFAKKVGIKQSVGKEFHSADKGADYKSLPKKVKEGEVTRTATGLKHSGDFPDYPKANGREFQSDPDRLNKSETGRLDKSFGVSWEPKGKRKEISGDPTGVNEAEISEEMLAGELYKDLQIFKKGKDKDIGSKAKNKDLANKPTDKEIIAKVATMANEDKDPCWKGYKQIGMKDKAGKKVPNCVPVKEEDVSEDWQKVNKSDKTDGMSSKAVKAYRRENPGSKLKTAVTTKPSKLKAGSKDAKRRKSFCARMSGVEGPMKDEHGKPTPKAKALKRWNC